MLRLGGLFLSCLLALAAAPAFAQPAPVQAQRPTQVQRIPQARLETPTQQQTQTPTQVVLPAQELWRAAGVNVEAGYALTINAQGQWSSFARSANSVAASRVSTVTDANGYANIPAGAGAPLPNANRGALIGRIGRAGAPFLIGASYAGEARGSGMLFVTMNEPAEQMQDNQGRLAISVSAAAPPPRQPQQPEPAPDAAGAQPTPAPEPDQPQAPPGAQAPADPNAPAADPTIPPPAPNDVAPRTEPIIPTPLLFAGIAALVLLAFLLASRLTRPNTDDNDRTAAGAQVSARVVNDGIASQSLSIKTKR